MSNQIVLFEIVFPNVLGLTEEQLYGFGAPFEDCREPTEFDMEDYVQ